MNAMVTHELAYTPVIVLGDARRRELASAVARRIEFWLKEWAVGVDLQSIAVDIAPVESSSSRVSAAQSKSVISGCIANIEYFTVGVVNGVARVQSADNTPMLRSHSGAIAAVVCGQMLRSLATTLVADIGAGEWSFETAQDLARNVVVKAREKWWTANIAWGSQSFGLQMTLSSTFIDRIAPLKRLGNLSGIQKRRTGIGEELVRLEAVLGEASVSVGELASLAVNDVIVLRDDMSKLGCLITGKGDRVANVSLGRVGNRRAVAISK